MLGAVNQSMKQRPVTWECPRTLAHFLHIVFIPWKWRALSSIIWKVNAEIMEIELNGRPSFHLPGCHSKVILKILTPATHWKRKKEKFGSLLIGS